MPESRPRRRGNAIWRIMAIVAGVVIILPLLIPLRPQAGTLPARELAVSGSRWVEVDGLDVHYLEAGTGPVTLVLLHGFGASALSWLPVLEPLAALGMRVVAFDRPGFGLTERPLPGDWAGPTPYGTEFAVDLTVGLMDKLGIDRAVLVGHSAGALVATLVAARYPDRVQALVLEAPAIGLDGSAGHGLPSWLQALGRTPQLRRLGPLLVRTQVARLESVLDLAWHDPSRLDATARAAYKLPLRVAGWDQALWEVMLAPRTPPTGDPVAGLGQSVLYVTGDDDRIVPPAGTEALAARTPSAKLVVVDDCGHLPHEEWPAKFVAAVGSWLSEEGLTPVAEAGP